MASNNSYSFFTAVQAVSPKSSKNFIFTTVCGTLGRIESLNASGKLLVTGSMAINGRAKVINGLLGTNFGDDETVWANVNIWEDRAKRFEHMLDKLGNPTKLRLVLVGALSVKNYKKKDGTAGKSVNFAVQDWMLVPSSNSSAASSKPANTPSNENVRMDEEGFIELDDNGDDLPF